uniref:Uncharacterized protein n=1 Tax=Podoviridae sp. ctIKM86 TaxID=2827729 RepID=A0A8S5SMW6_9CAUD|nr:MAG TPA: hypothetical protein [Podoviridae sp. ctIKM86]
MAKYKVTNLDAPIEADYWVDIPIRDPDTNKDMVDEEGRILVQRHVTRTVKQKEYQSIIDKVPTYDNLVTSYNTYVTENNKQVKLISEMATTATNNVTKLTETVNNHDSQIHALYTKINAIQGIDIDDFKLVTETNIKNIKNSYLPLAGGTLTGAVAINHNLTVTGTITSTFHGNLTGNVVGNVTGNITGSAKSATNDSSNRNIVNTYALKGNYPDRIKFGWDTTHKNYVNVTVDVTTWGLITTGNISSQSVNHAKISDKANSADMAKKATSADYATNSINAVNATAAVKATQDGTGAIITNTYVKRTSEQTISAQHNFSNGVKVSGYLVTIG